MENPFKIKVRVLDSGVRVEVAGMRVDKLVPSILNRSEIIAGSDIRDALMELSGLFARALAEALAEEKERQIKLLSAEQNKLVGPDGKTPLKRSNITPGDFQKK